MKSTVQSTDRLCFTKIRKPWKHSLKKMLNQILKPSPLLQTRFSIYSSTITLRELLSSFTLLNISRSWPALFRSQDFHFKSFMAAYKFYNQYALKTNDGEYYLESMEDRVFFNALYLQMEMKLSRETSQTKLSTNATNQRLLLS